MIAKHFFKIQSNTTDNVTDYPEETNLRYNKLLRTIQTITTQETKQL